MRCEIELGDFQLEVLFDGLKGFKGVKSSSKISSRISELKNKGRHLIDLIKSVLVP